MSKARDLADIVASGSILADGTLSTTEIDGVTASAAELNKLDGATATTAELNYVAGVTSAIQTQIDGKQATDAQLTDIAGLTPTDGNIIIGNGSNFITESGSTARTSLGLGSIATAATSDYAATANNLSDLGSASTARTNLGLAINSDVLGYVAPSTSGNVLTSNGSSWVSQAAGGGSWVAVSDAESTNVASVTISLSGGTTYVLVVRHIERVSTGSGVLYLEWGNLTASSWEYGGAYYDGVNTYWSAGNQAKAQLVEGRLGVASGALYGRASMDIAMYTGNVSGHFPGFYSYGKVNGHNTARPQAFHCAGHYDVSGASATSVKFTSNSGNINMSYVLYKLLT